MRRCLSLPSECRYVGVLVSPGGSVAAFSLYDNSIRVYLVTAGPTESRLVFRPLLALQRDGYVPQRLMFLEWNEWDASPAGPSRYEALEGRTRIEAGTLVASNLLDEAERHSIDLLRISIDVQRVGRTEAANRATGLTVERLDPFSCFVTAFGISRHANLDPELFFGDRHSNSVRFMSLKF